MNYDERVAYLEGLIYMATIDENVTENEFEHFSQVGQMYGISQEAVENIKSNILSRERTLVEILSPIRNRKTKLAFIYELMALCFVDGTYSLAEINGMKTVCDILEVEQEKLTEFESLIAESIDLQTRINLILEQ